MKLNDSKADCPECQPCEAVKGTCEEFNNLKSTIKDCCEACHHHKTLNPIVVGHITYMLCCSVQ